MLVIKQQIIRQDKEYRLTTQINCFQHTINSFLTTRSTLFFSKKKIAPRQRRASRTTFIFFFSFTNFFTLQAICYNQINTKNITIIDYIIYDTTIYIFLCINSTYICESRYIDLEKYKIIIEKK